MTKTAMARNTEVSSAYADILSRLTELAATDAIRSGIIVFRGLARPEALGASSRRLPSSLEGAFEATMTSIARCSEVIDRPADGLESCEEAGATATNDCLEMNTRVARRAARRTSRGLSSTDRMRMRGPESMAASPERHLARNQRRVTQLSQALSTLEPWHL